MIKEIMVNNAVNAILKSVEQQLRECLGDQDCTSVKAEVKVNATKETGKLTSFNLNLTIELP